MPGLGAEEHPSLVAVLQSFAARQDASVPLGTLMGAFGGRVHAMALFILVLPETIPLPLPSIAAILGIPLLLIAAHLVLYGEGGTLPARVRGVTVPISTIRVVLRYLGPVLSVFERVSRPRWGDLARQERLAGVACLYLALVLVLPIPFVNLIPAVCLALIAFGVAHRDGLYVALGLALTAGATIALVIFAQQVAALFTGT